MAYTKFLTIAGMALMLVACGDDSSSGAKDPDKVAEPDEESSSSLVIPNDWSWDVPKEARLNPEITYGTMTDSRDKKVYKTVKVGDQIWMAENLNYADSATTASLKASSWCYKDVAKNCDVAGRLYTWAAAMDSVKTGCGCGLKCSSTLLVRGICPPGWHLPDTTEWSVLFTAVGGESTAGEVLKAQSGWNSSGNGSDAIGFSALPAGDRDIDGNFINEGEHARFWSSTEYNGSNAFSMYLYYKKEDAGLYLSGKDFGYSVRCLKDY
jgi:uncharacterized protein (TIGR02145 family)